MNPSTLMDKGSTMFYHKHIKNNIQKVDQRTQSFIKHRKQFLKKYCEPLQEKVQKLDKEIDFYNHLIENQNEMIQNQAQVTELKKEISEFLATQKYFLEHLEQHQEKILEVTVENKFIQDKIKKIREQMGGITKRKSERVYQQLSQRDNISMRSCLNNSRLFKMNDRSSDNKSTNKVVLPAIFQVQKFYAERESSQAKNKEATMHRKKSLHKSFTVDVERSFFKDSRVSTQTKIKNPNLSIQQEIDPNKIEIQKKQPELKAKFKQIMTSFNKFELLFKECFEKKKLQVQKSVSQLQSRLISDRQKFLEICEAISSKDVKSLTFEQFQALTGDQIMTLLISFPWIQKKIFKQFIQRRKNIIEVQQSKNF